MARASERRAGTRRDREARDEMDAAWRTDRPTHGTPRAHAGGDAVSPAAASGCRVVMRASSFTREELLAVLNEVMDPEVPVLSVVELGIVRDVEVHDDGVTVTVTPTYSGCPALRVIEED